MSGYVLRDRDRSELERLRFQHEVWRAESEDLLDRCPIEAGDRVLDLGCGPGFLSLDLAARVGETGRVTAVDSSERFTGFLLSRLGEPRGAPVEVVCADLLGWEPPAGGFDAAVCRWVLTFLSDPAAVIRSAFAALRPGGVLGVLEYFPFLDVALEPRDEVFDRIYRAVARLIRDAGGDPDVGGRVPAMLEEAGFTRKAPSGHGREYLLTRAGRDRDLRREIRAGRSSCTAPASWRSSSRAGCSSTSSPPTSGCGPAASGGWPGSTADRADEAGPVLGRAGRSR